MRKHEKRQVEEFIRTLDQAHAEIKSQIEKDNITIAKEILNDCQAGAVQLGSLIETAEGKDCTTISLLEDYCELVYQIHEAFGCEAQSEVSERSEIPKGSEVSEGSKIAESVKANKVYKRLRKQLTRIENSVKFDIKERLEIVFLPYKASMWDSLESVWMAADADEYCDTYVVPIPYYDRNPDGSLGQYHYEGNELPVDVPVLHYESYNLEIRRPDVVYIHNPYDDYNYVTTIDPRFYSRELKKYTDTLVYIPYYSTTGGMAEAQMYCPAYHYADYIITQAEKYRKFFDPSLPDEKLKPFGSPKFDRIIRICNHPPKPPAKWQEKLKGKKVYFYNTSIQGMLGNTDAFLKKMKYVFDCFAGRNDACLLWRPHPLLESTLDSMRSNFKPVYDQLKRYFIENDIGIYDDTIDMTNTIALCDAYIGDSATSVTSLFGIVGKPLFILDNNIHSAPEEDDWRGRAITGFNYFGNDEWMLAQGNKLYRSEHKDYTYRYYCDLSDYAAGSYYSCVITIGEKHYACPANARDIVVIGDRGIEKRIKLEPNIEQAGAFRGGINWKNYLFLIPNNFPSIVKYDTETGEISYIGEHLDVFIRYVDGEKRIGGIWAQEGYLYLASPADNHMLVINAETGEERVLTLNVSHSCGCAMLIPDGLYLWMLPYDGYVITRWNTVTGKAYEYRDYPDNLMCMHPVHGFSCSQTPFSIPAVCSDYVYFPPQWANMYIRLNKKTGEMREWKPPMEMPEERANGYYPSWVKSYFTRPAGEYGACEYHLFSVYDRKLYRINLETEEYREVAVEFDREELEANEPGFWEDSEWLQYACNENAFNSLTDFLGGRITGSEFDRERQVRAYSKIAANNDGSCGEKTHGFICGQCLG